MMNTRPDEITHAEQEGESRNKFELERRKIQEALKLNQVIGEGLREVSPIQKSTQSKSQTNSKVSLIK